MALEPATLLAAAAAQTGDAPNEAARELLGFLQWDLDAPPDLRANRAALLKVAASCRRVFRLRVRDAPRLYCFGAEIDLAEIAGEPGLQVLGTSGLAEAAGAAFAACIGEAVEFAAQVETPAARAMRRGDTVLARHWSGDGLHPLPFDHCYRRAPARVTQPAPRPLSIGCAAAPTAAEARLRAVLELIERDAVALWWIGGRAGRPLPPALEATAAATLAAWRARKTGRVTWAIDITTDLGVPAAAAISFAADGTGFCCGTAARATLQAAAEAALRELCQNELGQRIVAARAAERGDEGLDKRDRATLERKRRVRPNAEWLLHPKGAAGPDEALHGSAAQLLTEIARRLATAGFDLWFVEHAADPVPVWRAICDSLACTPSTSVPPRLLAAIAKTGGGPGQRRGIMLHA
ncbi:YcaO-like family protein [Sabulicella rubraurantiaca]|uniref:YcaO-like family protein n=1 Tax=Sabulicella rubraurantiaca TaxID=2811429 RepID=UPI001A95A357|nr:YcaO-like family protein [Sabulicella rubraurantiaca]